MGLDSPPVLLADSKWGFSLVFVNLPFFAPKIFVSVNMAKRDSLNILTDCSFPYSK